jgi:inhibitor of cysteine peptidase
MMIPLPAIVNIGVVCLITIAFAGCLGSNQGNPESQGAFPTGTPVQVGHLVVNERQNTATIYVNQSDTITLRLLENPTTGYEWNLTTTPGLRVTNDTYLPSPTSGKVVGSGGTHIWDMAAVSLGEQKIQGIYKRPWEPVSGNETTFTMTVVVKQGNQ